MVAVKRKRGDVAAATSDAALGQSSRRPVTTLTSGKELRDAIAGGSAAALASASASLRIPHTQLASLTIRHPTSLLVQQLLALDPKLDDLFRLWRRAQGTGRDVADPLLLKPTLHLLRNILDVMSHVAFFRPQARAIAEVVLSASEPFGQQLMRLVTAQAQDQAQLGLGLLSSLAHIDSERLRGRVWMLFVEGGGMRALPRLLATRRRSNSTVATLDHPDVRVLACHFLSPFLAHPPLVAGLTDKILKPLFHGLVYDAPSMVVLTLEAVWRALVASTSRSTNRQTAVALLTESSIEGLIALYTRDDVEEDAIITKGHSSRTVADVAHHFLLAVCTHPGQGICFPDQGWYPRRTTAEEDDPSSPPRGVHNRTLQRVLRGLGGKVVDDARLSALVVAILGACPELVQSYWTHSGLSVDPKLSSRWIATVGFIGRIVSLPPPTTLQSDAAPPLSAMIESILPSPLLKSHLSRGLLDASPLVQHLTALTLIRCLQKLHVTQQLLATSTFSQALRELEWEARKRVPEVAVVIAFAQRAAGAQHALLTEAALRLFGLFWRTLPSLVGEVRFDVGRLLVGSSSVKAEARARRQAREGGGGDEDDAADETQSIGTVGTAGMGGGFGQARGDVERFDALSQSHVLQLLGDARTWDWSHKAAGSTHTYVYHMLQLYLGTRHAHTRAAVSRLLQSKLSATLLFDHDADEVEVWLDALSRTRRPDVPASAALMTEQLHLLAMLDDCLRRVLQRPFVYLERGQLAVGTGRVSPLLWALVEQLQAKVGQQLVSNEAALVVARYMRLVAAGLRYKVDDEYAQEMREVMIAAIAAAEEKRGSLSALRRQMEAGADDVSVVGEDDLEMARRRVMDGQVVEADVLKGIAASIPVSCLVHHRDHLARDDYLAIVSQRTSRLRRLQLFAAHQGTLDRDVLAALAAQEPALLGRLLDDVEAARAVARDPGALQPLLTSWLLDPAQRARRTAFESQIKDALQWIDLVSSHKAAEALASLADAVSPDVLARLLRKVSPADIIARSHYFSRHASLLDVATLALEERVAAGSIGELERGHRDVPPSIAAAALPPRFLAAAIRLSPAIARQSWAQASMVADATVIAAWHDVGFNLAELNEAIAAKAPCHVLAAWPQLAATNQIRQRILDELHLDAILAVGLVADALPRILAHAQQLLDREHLTADDSSWLVGAARVLDTLDDDLPVADRLLTTIAQDHHRHPAALLVARSASRAPLKGPLLRQLLQLLVSPERVAELCRSPPPPAYIAWLHTLFLSNPYITCQPSFFQPLVALYGGTLALADQQLLDIWLAAERQTRTSLASLLMCWGGTSAERPMDLVGKLDSRKTFTACIHFPLRRGLEPREEDAVGYDPIFLLSILNLALEGSGNLSGLDWVELLRSNLLALAVAALSSRRVEMRQAGATSLARALQLIPTSSFQEQPALLRLLRVVRHAHATARLPPLLACFLAHALRSLGDPSSHLYPTLSAFLLRRPAVDPADVPALYETLYAAGSDGRRSRRWIVRLIRDGCRSSADWRIVRRRHTFPLIASIYATSRDAALLLSILEAVRSMVRIESAAKQLVERQGLLGWIEAVALPRGNETMRGVVVDILDELPATDAPILAMLAEDADLDLLSRLSAIADRLASLSSLAPLTARLCSLDRSLSRSSALADPAWVSCVSHLARLAFKQPHPDLSAHQLLRRAAILDSELGRWIRSGLATDSRQMMV